MKLGTGAALLLVLGLGCAGPAASLGEGPSPPRRQQPAGFREAAFAGSFYPADARALGAALDGFLADAVRADGHRPIALVAPHAGYIFSGQVAADAWTQAAGHAYDVIVLLGTNHTGVNAGRTAIYEGAGFQTPIGPVRVDAALVASLLSACGRDCAADAAPHAREHSVEVHLPFARRLFPSTPIVAAIVAPGDAALAERFGKALASVLAGRRPLIVASSDLSHYPPAAEAADVDRRTVEAIVSMDPGRIRAAAARADAAGSSGLVTCACGEAPILAAVVAARALGAKRARAVSYANSGYSAVADARRAVGYGAVALADAPPGADLSGLPGRMASSSGAVSEADRSRLLALARNSIGRYLASQTLPLPRGFGPEVQRELGVFVTLRKRGELRGCIGQMESSAAIPQAVQRMALAAAFEDRRFERVKASEMREIQVEISLLTPLGRVKGPGDVRPGRDGVLLQKEGRSAVFLPQVATEEGWGRDELLDNLCQKAGLARGCWRSGASLSTFQAEVFSERR